MQFPAKLIEWKNGYKEDAMFKDEFNFLFVILLIILLTLDIQSQHVNVKEVFG